MRKFGRNKIALLLLLLRFSGGKTSAMELNKVKTQNLQTLDAVGGEATKNSNRGFINWVKNHKCQLGIGGALTATVAVMAAVLGVKCLSKNKDNNNIDEILNNTKDDNNIVEISNNTKSNKTTKVLDVNKPKNGKQKSAKMMSNEEAVMDCVGKFNEFLQLCKIKQEVSEFYSKNIKIALNTILERENEVLDALPPERVVAKRDIKQFIEHLKIGKVLFCGNSENIMIDYKNPNNEHARVFIKHKKLDFLDVLFFTTSGVNFFVLKENNSFEFYKVDNQWIR